METVYTGYTDEQRKLIERLRSGSNDSEEHEPTTGDMAVDLLFTGDRRIRVTQALIDITGLDLKKVKKYLTDPTSPQFAGFAAEERAATPQKNFFEGPGVPVYEGISAETAEGIQDILTGLGATATIRQMEDTHHLQ